jgi:hypothetical protein
MHKTKTYRTEALALWTHTHFKPGHINDGFLNLDTHKLGQKGNGFLDLDTHKPRHTSDGFLELDTHKFRER